VAHVRLGQDNYPVVFDEHEHAHGSAHRDNNMRAAVIHVMADAAVSVLVIVGLLLARAFAVRISPCVKSGSVSKPMYCPVHADAFG
jgi:hypothetical protein